MLKISLDEGAVFDMLSILHIKSVLINDANKRTQNDLACDKLTQEIVDQITWDKLEEILWSQEYWHLVLSNLDTFLSVEQIRDRPSYGNEILDEGKSADNANLIRFMCKKALQQKFFNTDLLEVKT